MCAHNYYVGQVNSTRCSALALSLFFPFSPLVPSLFFRPHRPRPNDFRNCQDSDSFEVMLCLWFVFKLLFLDSIPLNSCLALVIYLTLDSWAMSILSHFWFFGWVSLSHLILGLWVSYRTLDSLAGYPCPTWLFGYYECPIALLDFLAGYPVAHLDLTIMSVVLSHSGYHVPPWFFDLGIPYSQILWLSWET